MRLKLLFIVGLGVGYVLGARAGRPRYEQIKAKATDAWEDPRVQKVVTETQDFVKENAPIVQEKVIEGTKAAVAGAQDAAERASDIAKDLSGKIADTSKAVSDKVGDSGKDISGKVVKSAKSASKSAKETSRKVAKSAKKASTTVAKTAKDVRDKIIVRGEEAVDGVVIAVGTARDDALEIEPDDDK